MDARKDDQSRDYRAAVDAEIYFDVHGDCYTETQCANPRRSASGGVDGPVTGPISWGEGHRIGRDRDPNFP